MNFENVSTADLIAQTSGNPGIVPDAAVPIQQPTAQAAPVQDTGESEFSKTLQDAISGFAQSATFGLSDEIGALTLMALNGGDYDTQLALSRSRLDAAAERSPVASAIGGAVGVAPAVVAGLASANPILLETGIGTLTGFGTGEGAKDSLQGGLFGSMLSFGGGAAGKGLANFVKTPVATRLSNMFKKSAGKFTNNKVDDLAAKVAEDVVAGGSEKFSTSSVKLGEVLTDFGGKAVDFANKHPFISGAALGVGTPGGAVTGSILATDAILRGVGKVAPNALPIAGARLGRAGNGPADQPRQPPIDSLESISTDELIRSMSN